MTDASEELKEKTVHLRVPDADKPETSTEKNTDQLAPTSGNEQGKEAASAKQNAAELNDVQRARLGYRRLRVVFGIVMVAILCFIGLANIVFMIQTPAQIASFNFESPAVSDMEELNGVGFNLMVSGKRTLRFVCHKPVKMKQQETMRRYTSQDKEFNDLFDNLCSYFPYDKEQLEKHRDSIEIWHRDYAGTLLHDKESDVYLFYAEAG